jgi:hypothetical protein
VNHIEIKLDHPPLPSSSGVSRYHQNKNKQDWGGGGKQA